MDCLTFIVGQVSLILVQPSFWLIRAPSPVYTSLSVLGTHISLQPIQPSSAFCSTLYYGSVACIFYGWDCDVSHALYYKHVMFLPQQYEVG